jgi:hypothetical protein
MRSYTRKWLLCSVALIAPLMLAGCADSGRSLDGLNGQRAETVGSDPHSLGVYHFQNGHYGLAIQHFERATKDHPSSVESLNGLGASYDQLGRFDLAERHYRRAMLLDPQSAQTLNNMGYSYWLQGKHDLALAFLRDADGLDEGSRLIAANRELASASLRDIGVVAEAPQTADAGGVADTNVQQKRGARIERVTTSEQILMLKAPAVPASFGGLPEKANAAVSTQADAGVPLSLSYLPAQTAFQAPASESRAEMPTAKAAAPLQTAAVEEQALERNQLEIAPVLFVETVPLPALEAVAAAVPDETLAAKADEVDAVPEAETFVASFGPQAPAWPIQDGVAEETLELAEVAEETFLSDAPLVLAPSSADLDLETTPELAVAPEASEAPDDVITAFFASLVSGLKSFFDTSEPVAFTADAYVGPYGTEAGGRHHALGLARPDQYVAASPRIELSDATGRSGAAERIGDFLEDRGLLVDGLQGGGEASQAVTTIYYGEGWEVYASGLAGMLPAEVKLEVSDQEGVDIHIQVGDDLLAFDRDLIAEDGLRVDDISG